MYKQILLIALIVASVQAFDFKLFTSEIMEEVNNYNTGSTWKAGYNKRFEGMSFDQIQAMMGTIATPVHMIPDERYTPFETIQNLSLPESFDLREAYPKCESLQQVRDQSNCGSCWAFGTVEAISDRICIASGQKDQTRISSENLLSCCRGTFACGMGCNGGYTAGAWNYYVKTGLVSGNLYTDDNQNSKTECQPYSFPPCSHHVQGEYQACTDLPQFNTPKCYTECNSQYTQNSYEQDLHKGVSSYSVPKSEEQIKAEIYQYGSTTASFNVYSDFLTYSSGVYQNTSGSYMGGHAIKMLGWGVENGTPYWLCANSWNSSWGENGFFKILRGSNECGIESGMVAGFVPGQQ
uniref:Cathepsin B n=1 Tax=Uronema marinum TaxID=35107 RepID=Q6SSE0_UROMR|nr:cathepsin B [Uronema marinum]